MVFAYVLLLAMNGSSCVTRALFFLIAVLSTVRCDVEKSNKNNSIISPMNAMRKSCAHDLSRPFFVPPS